MVQAVSKVK